MQPAKPSRFSFVDEGEAVRRLNVDRDTLLELVASKRLRAYPGVGKGNFFRVGDLDTLADELHPATGDCAYASWRRPAQPNQPASPT